jgi:hypothetical protein
MATKSELRRQRLASALRENLKRRKALARSRQADPNPRQPDSPGQDQPKNVVEGSSGSAGRLSP